MNTQRSNVKKRKMYSPSEAASEIYTRTGFEYSDSTIYRFIGEEGLGHIKGPGTKGRIMIPEKDLMEFIKVKFRINMEDMEA